MEVIKSGSDVITGVLRKESGGSESEEGDVKMERVREERKCYPASFVYGEESRNADNL